MTYFRKFCYLNSSCIRKSITLMFMSSSRNKFTLLYQNAVKNVFVGFRPPCWCPSRWAPAWRLHTNPFISRILVLNYRTVLIVISIYFEWLHALKTSNFIFSTMFLWGMREYTMISQWNFFHFCQKMLSPFLELCLSFATCHPREPPTRPRPFPSHCFGS